MKRNFRFFGHHKDKTMDADFFETALVSGKIDKFVVGETIPSLANKYKGSCVNCENLALDFISNRPVPVLNDFIKVDTPYKLERTINLIRTKKKYDDDMQCYAVHLIGVTDLFVCSILNDGLIHIYQKVKDKETKVNLHKITIETLWSLFLLKFHSEFNIEIMVSLKNLLGKWNEMLKKTEHKTLFDEAKRRVHDILKKLKNLKDKSVGTSDGIGISTLDISTADFGSYSSKIDSKKRHYESLCEIESLLKSMNDYDAPLETPPRKKPKTGLHKYFIADDELSDDNCNRKEPLKETLLDGDICNKNNKTPKADILKEKPDDSYKSPVKQSNINKEEKENDVEITYFSSNKNITSPSTEKNVTPTSDTIKKSLHYETPTKKNAYQIMMEAARKRSVTNPVKGTVASREDLEGFVSFLVVLKNHYRDNLEIPRTVIQLLHIYQPEQGLDEYLRLSRLLCFLLIDFPEEFITYLLSIIPPPEHIPREIIKREILKATGKKLLCTPAFHSRNHF